MYSIASFHEDRVGFLKYIEVHTGPPGDEAAYCFYDEIQ